MTGHGRGDAGRVFVTAALVYLAFLNPTMPTSVTSVSLDAAVSVVDGGRWEVTDRHRATFGDVDVTTAGVPAVPPGLALVAMPVYAAWRALGGGTSLDTLHVVGAIALGTTVGALTAVQVAWLARWLGASPAAAVAAALAFAFGTPAFVFGTRLQKEPLAALAVIAALRLALASRGRAGAALAGIVAGAGAVVAYPVALVVPVVAAVVRARGGAVSALGVLAGASLPLAGLAVYNTAFFGAPWRFSYAALASIPGGADAAVFSAPSPATLLALLLHPRGGLLLYAPFVLLALAGLAMAWRRRPTEALAVSAFALALWLLSGAWLSTFPDLANGTVYLHAAVPALAPFAALVLDGPSRRAATALAGVSVTLTYLVVQAGHMADASPATYAVKTFLSGTGMGVLFKESLPLALGLETLHTHVGRADVGALDVLRRLAAGEGWGLVRNQALMLAINLTVLGGIALVLRRLWTTRPSGARAAAAVPVR